jgi:hypothetical protein
VLLAPGWLSPGRWELRYRRQRIAQIRVSDPRTLRDGPLYQRDGSTVATLKLERSTVRRSQLELLIVPALANPRRRLIARHSSRRRMTL